METIAYRRFQARENIIHKTFSVVFIVQNALNDAFESKGFYI